MKEQLMPEFALLRAEQVNDALCMISVPCCIGGWPSYQYTFDWIFKVDPVGNSGATNETTRLPLLLTWVGEGETVQVISPVVLTTPVVVLEYPPVSKVILSVKLPVISVEYGFKIP